MTVVDGADAEKLVAEGIHVHFEGVRAVDGVDLTLEHGQIMGLIGPNGAGKTTFMNAVSSFVDLTAGRVLLGGVQVTSWKPERLAKSGLVRTIAKQFQATYHTPLGNHYALPGYALADALVGAIKAAGSTDGEKIAEALFGGKVSVSYFGSTMKFTEKCHRPQPAVYSIEQFTNGKDKQIDSWKLKSVPNIGDGSPCSGTPPNVG